MKGGRTRLRTSVGSVSPKFQIWLGDNYEGMDRTVDSHIKTLRRKIEPDPADPTFIQTVYGVGYRFQGEGS